MADIINLRQARKQQKRANEEKQANANRLKFGQTKAQKKLHQTESNRANAAFDAHKREE